MPALSCFNLSSKEQAELKQLVWQALEKAVECGAPLTPEPPESQKLLTPLGCFVTLYVNKELRGCIGTYAAQQSLWQNVSDYTYYSACEDRRFTPLEKRELPALSFEISVLSELLPLQNDGEQALLGQLQPGIDGLLLKDAYHSAIFLPTVWQSLPAAHSFVQALKQKGGWPRDYWSEAIKIFRFETFVIASDEKSD